MTDTSELKHLEEQIEAISREVDPNSWHLDKKVPIAVIFAILIQSGAVIWFGGKLSTRVDNLESIVKEHTLSLVDRKDEDHERAERIVKLESFRTHIDRQLDRMNSKLDQLLQWKRSDANRPSKDN